jgi:Domain of unknown function (DUF4804)
LGDAIDFTKKLVDSKSQLPQETDLKKLGCFRGRFFYKIEGSKVSLQRFNFWQTLWQKISNSFRFSKKEILTDSKWELLTLEKLKELSMRFVATAATTEDVVHPPAESTLPAPAAEAPSAPAAEAPSAPAAEAPSAPAAVMPVSTAITYNELVAKSAQFERHYIGFPVDNNKIQEIIKRAQESDRLALQERIECQATATHPIAHSEIQKLIENFLEEKRQSGSDIEKALYVEMTNEAFIQRLIEKRPLVFYDDNDQFRLRNRHTGNGNWELIGTEGEKAPLVLREYLSYDEIAISAMLGFSTPTFFINDGNRENAGKLSSPNTAYYNEGVYCGLVGARLEKEGVMEHRHMVISEEQNSQGNPFNLNNPIDQIFSRFYGMERIPSFSEFTEVAQGKQPGAEITVGNQKYVYLQTSVQHPGIETPKVKFLNITAYKKRLKMSIEPFLIDANARAKKEEKKAYVVAVGLGLGAWSLDPVDIQAKFMLEVYAEILKDSDFSEISDIDFIHCGKTAQKPLDWQAPGQNAYKFNGIDIHFSKRNPGEKVEDGKLLVAQYAFDGNAFPGNEYWNSTLCASGDPAAACCSTIQELQNPYINPNVSGKNTHFLSKGVGVQSTVQPFASSSIVAAPPLLPPASPPPPSCKQS